MGPLCEIWWNEIPSRVSVTCYIYRPGTAPRRGVYISDCYNKLTTNPNNLGEDATGYLALC